MPKRTNKTLKNDEEGSSAPKNLKVMTESNRNDKTKTDVTPQTEKYFVLKHTFKDMSSLKADERKYSTYTEGHFGVQWQIFINNKEGNLAIFLSSTWPKNSGNSSIETDFSLALISSTGNKEIKETTFVFKTGAGTQGYTNFMKWSEMESGFVVDDKLSVEVRVKILKTTTDRTKLRNFDETTEKFSDLVLDVKGEKFYVPKLYLAAQSKYFEKLYLDNGANSKKTEIKLDGVDPYDFQLYLELLYSEKIINDLNVEGIIVLARMFDTEVVIRDCEDFLLVSSQKTLKKKVQMSIKYNLEKLKTKILSEIKTIADIRTVVPGTAHDLDPSIVTILLKKAVSN